MSAPINDGGPAFPGPETTTNPQGMSLRDWFAGQALAGMLADHERNGYPKDYAKNAYLFADAMIAARNAP
jgi:hypothetical protein